MDTTTIHELPYAEDTDELLTWPATQQANAEALDGLIATWGTAADLPAAGKPGRIFRLTGGEVYLDVGTGWVELARAPTIPIGAQLPYGGTTDPPGGEYLLADGRLVAQATYPLLEPAIGHRYNLGVDPGGGMVRLPDKRGRASVGADSMGTTGASGILGTYPRTVGERGGSREHTLLRDQMPQHAHTTDVAMRGAAEQGVFGGSIPIASTFGPNWIGQYTSSGVNSHAGAATPHPILQPYEVDAWIVRVA
jgi:microcystin-dependent protein